MPKGFGKLCADCKTAKAWDKALGQNPRKPYFIWDKTERQIVATQGDERTDGTRWTKPMLEEFAEDNNYREGGEEWVVTNEDVVDGVDIWGGRGGENPRIVGSRVEEMERVGQTILQQLGGKKFTLMTGAKNFVLGDGYLKFRIGRNSKGVSLVKITLMPSDTYLVEFFKGVTLHSASSAPKLVSRHDDVYADQLSELFARVTGMDTVPPRFGSNPRTVPTRDEMKAKSLGALVLGGEVNLWLIKDSPTFFVFCEDDGDHTQAAGHSQSEALAVAKRLWPNCTFYPSPRQERPGTGRGRGNPLDLKNWWVFAVAGNKPVGILKHRHTTRHPRQHSMVRMAWSTKSRKRGKWMPLDVLVEKSFISDRRQAFEYAQLALAEVQSKAVVG